MVVGFIWVVFVVFCRGVSSLVFVYFGEFLFFVGIVGEGVGG